MTILEEADALAARLLEGIPEDFPEIGVVAFHGAIRAFARRIVEATIEASGVNTHAAIAIRRELLGEGKPAHDRGTGLDDAR